MENNRKYNEKITRALVLSVINNICRIRRKKYPSQTVTYSINKNAWIDSLHKISRLNWKIFLRINKWVKYYKCIKKYYKLNCIQFICRHRFYRFI